VKSNHDLIAAESRCHQFISNCGSGFQPRSSLYHIFLYTILSWRKRIIHRSSACRIEVPPQRDEDGPSVFWHLPALRSQSGEAGSSVVYCFL